MGDTSPFQTFQQTEPGITGVVHQEVKDEPFSAGHSGDGGSGDPLNPSPVSHSDTEVRQRIAAGDT